MSQQTDRIRARRSVSGAIRLMLLASALLTTAVAAQSPAATEPSQTQQAPAPYKSMDSDMDMSTPMQNMDKMAVTMARMAELCEQMMQMEMEKAKTMKPYLFMFSALITLILLLLVVLQVQWIIHWKRLLQARMP